VVDREILMGKYIPNPIDTSKITLDESLIDLTERLSHNIHEVWSKGRLEDGWVYGEKRDDTRKLHPCLIPYSELSETEKDFDRNSAIETLKFIVKLGCQITSPYSLSFSEKDKLAVKLQLDNILKTKLLSDLVSVWRDHNQTIWKTEPGIYLQLGLCFLKSSEPLLAYDVFSEGLECFPEPTILSDDDKKLFINMSQQQALALAETGAVYEAADILHSLKGFAGSINAETFGLLGRTYKEMALSEGVEQEAQQKYLEQSYSYYFTAFEAALKNKNDDDAYYNGINAATVALFRGDDQQSVDIANQVSDICKKVIAECERTSNNVMYWVDATLGEAELLKGNMDLAKVFYQSAVDKIENDMRGQISMHKQVRKIFEYKKIKDKSFDSIFQQPTVLVFSGHMIDSPGSEVERFPAESESSVRDKIKNVLSGYQTCIAYSSAACGADIIFLEEVIEKGGEINITLPYDIESFKDQCVDFIPNSNWGKRFDALIAKATRVVILTQFNAEVSIPTYDFSNRYIYGLALARSKIINSDISFLSVWNGEVNNKVGGTASVINLWSNNQRSVTVIHPKNGIEIIKNDGLKKESSLIECKTSSNGADVKYYNFLPLLFADVKGYSKLNEKQLVTFSTVFLKYMSDIFAKYSHGIFSQRTQGDGLFVVFNSLQVAAECANDIKNIISGTDWEKYGLPEDLTIRISLDAGPIYSYIEPVTQNLEFCGDYVNRAARMEPITPPGHIYASETFVAMANVEELDEFNFAYAGQVVLPKGHGIIPAYHLYKN